MIEDPPPCASLRTVLDAVEDASPVQAVEAATRSLRAALRASSVSFLIADLSGRALVRLSHIDGRGELTPDAGGRRPADDPIDPSGGTDERRDVREVAVSVPLDRGAAGRALRLQAVQVVPPVATAEHDHGNDDSLDAGRDERDDGGDGHGDGRSDGRWTVLAPVSERGEALGLLELVLPSRPSPAAVAEIARTAHLLGYVVVASRRHTDLYEWAQRTTPYSLSAEIQRRLLPPAYTCEAGSFTLSAWLEPSASVGGDTYDYSLARDVLHLSMTDAMGHGVSSALTATLCVGSMRNSRRHGLSLPEQAAAANDALCAHHATVSTEAYCTGLLGRVDLTTGMLEMVNAGHAAPYLLRDGDVRILDLPPTVPFGLFPETEYASTVLSLRAGDRLVLVTDGMLERNAEDLDLPALIATTAHLHAREATRALTDLVLEATGHALADDATLLILDWHAHHGRERSTHDGTPA